MLSQDLMMRITSQNFSGPHKAEVVTHDHVYAVKPPETLIDQEELEVKLSVLLAQAARSGFDVEVTKHSDPTKGMGGYIPHITTRPVYKTVRAKMTEAAALDAHMKEHGCHGFKPADGQG
jgi:hypothetical protein